MRNDWKRLQKYANEGGLNKPLEAGPPQEKVAPADEYSQTLQLYEIYVFLSDCRHNRAERSFLCSETGVSPKELTDIVTRFPEVLFIKKDVPGIRHNESHIGLASGAADYLMTMLWGKKLAKKSGSTRFYVDYLLGRASAG